MQPFSDSDYLYSASNGLEKSRLPNSFLILTQWAVLERQLCWRMRQKLVMQLVTARGVWPLCLMQSSCPLWCHYPRSGKRRISKPPFWCVRSSLSSPTTLTLFVTFILLHIIFLSHSICCEALSTFYCLFTLNFAPVFWYLIISHCVSK